MKFCNSITRVVFLFDHIRCALWIGLLVCTALTQNWPRSFEVLYIATPWISKFRLVYFILAQILLIKPTLTPLWTCKKNLPLSSLFNIEKKKKLPPIALQHIKKNPFQVALSLATPQWKNKIKKKKSPLNPFLLPHVKWRQKKTLPSTPLPLNNYKKKEKIKVHPFPRPIMYL